MRWLAREPQAIGGTQLQTLEYDSTVNSKTYGEIQHLHSVASETLASLGFSPRDMIDVQSFLFVAYSVDQRDQGKTLHENGENGDPEESLDDKRPREERVPVHPDSPAVEDRLGRVNLSYPSFGFARPSQFDQERILSCISSLLRTRPAPESAIPRSIIRRNANSRRSSSNELSSGRLWRTWIICSFGVAFVVAM